MSVLQLLDLALSILAGVLASLSGSPKYAQLVASVQRGVNEIANARQQLITHEQLEALRTQPKW